MDHKIPDSHLQSPIRTVFRAYFHRPLSDAPEFLREIIENSPIKPSSIRLDSEKTYGQLLSGIYENNKVLKWTDENFSSTIGCIQEHVKDILEILDPSQLEYPELDYIPDIDDLRRYSEKVKWEDLRIWMQKLRSKTSHQWRQSKLLPHNVYELWYSGQYMIIKLKYQICYLLDYDQVMMIADTIASRCFSFLYNKMLCLHIPGKLSDDLIIKVLALFDKLFIEEGNDSYKHIKHWEAICIAILLHDHDRLSLSKNFGAKIKLAMEKDDLFSAIEMMDELSKLRLNVDQLSELHGFYRFWGHPTVNEEAGCRKVKEIAQNRPIPSELTLQNMDGLFVRQFCISFMKKHGRWPSVNPHRLPDDNALRNAITSHATTLDLYSAKFPLSDWHLLELCKEFIFDYYLDFTGMLDDKSISVKRSEVRTLYNKHSLGYDPGKPTTSRRVLIEALRTRDIDIKSICEKVQYREVPKEDRIIIVHAKERELKPDPRLFAMMTLPMRLFFTVTESNIKDQIFGYFPQQTMTLNQNTLYNRLYDLTSDEGKLLTISVYAHIDFKSWNLHWSSPSLIFLCKRLEELFGLPGHFSGGHWFFQKSLIALASHHNPPDSLINNPTGTPGECDTLWFNHYGGFEGIMQKLWTLQTIILLLLVEFHTGIKSIITGQGDNQVVKLMIPVLEEGLDIDTYMMKYEKEINSTIEKFLLALEQFSADLGLVVKLEESYVTKDILVYGKKVIFKGAFTSQATKRIARTLTDINELYPSLRDKISTLQTSGLATAQNGHSIIVPYIISQMETIFTIQRDIEWSLLLRTGMGNNLRRWIKMPSTIRFLLLYTSDIGGLPILPFLSFLYRGHPDSLTATLTEIGLLKDKSDIARKIWYFLETKQIEVGDGNPELLILNPCALNIKGARPPASIFKAFLTKKIRSITNNKYLSDIFSIEMSQYEKDLFKYLSMIQPLHPRILHEIYLNSIPGAATGFLSRFATTRTTQVLGSEDPEAESLIIKMCKSELDMMNILRESYLKIIKIEIPVSGTKELCPTKLASSLRLYTWGKLLKGRLIHGVTVPHPAHQFSLINHNLSQSQCYIHKEKILFNLIEIESQVLLRYRGPYPPYLGSKTREKRTGRIIVLPQHSRPISAAERLCQLISWCVEPGSNLYDFLVELMSTRTNIPVEILRLSSGEIASGSIIHRLNDHITKRSSHNNTLPNLTTFSYLSTDTLGKYSGGGDNYNIHLQGAILCGYSLLQIKATNSNQINGTEFSMHVNCIDCMEPILDVVLDAPSSELHNPNLSFNPLLYSKSEFLDPTSTNILMDSLLCSSKRDDFAAASILLSRIISTLNLKEWGVTEYSQTSGFNIGVQEILRIGLASILKSLSIYVILLFPYDVTKLNMLVNLLPLSIWAELAPLCLLPDILPSLYEVAEITLSDIFINMAQVSRLLTRALSRYVEQQFHILSHYPEEWGHNIVFYITRELSIRRVFFMWGRLISLISKNQYIIGDIVSDQKLGAEDYINLPNTDQINSLTLSIFRKYGEEGLKYCWITHRIQISRYSPGALLRISPLPVQGPRKIIKGRRSRDISTHISYISQQTYPMKLNIPLTSGVPEKYNPEYPAMIQTRVPYKLFDHTYHLWGHTSTSFMKILEILIVENINNVNSAAALGDGEGGIARLLAEYFSIPVIFNTFVDRSKLIPHRAANYIPSSFIDCPEKVLLSELSALYGGDLLDIQFIKILTHHIASLGHLDLLVCDAELLPYTPEKAITLIHHLLYIARASTASVLIVKLYFYSPLLMSDILGACGILYNILTVVTPTFSSNETEELYLVCSQYNRDIYNIFCYDSILHGERYRTSSHFSTFEILRLWSETRYSNQPHQLFRLPICSQLVNIAEKLGIPTNIVQSLERYCLNIKSYNKNQTIKEYLENAFELAYNASIMELEGFGLSQTGTPVRMETKIVMSGSSSIHRSLERYFTIQINIRAILSDIDELDKSFQEKYRSLISHIDYEHQLMYKGKVVYTLHLDWIKWSEEFLKLFWVIWGHILLEKDVLFKYLS